jgi:hypothetical protein
LWAMAAWAAIRPISSRAARVWKKDMGAPE